MLLLDIKNSECVFVGDSTIIRVVESRRSGARIVIDGEPHSVQWGRVFRMLSNGIAVTVRVVSTKAGRVRLAFDAPREVAIWREKLVAGVN
jgi:sRNA-binding carbon storage regulator CsrA